MKDSQSKAPFCSGGRRSPPPRNGGSSLRHLAPAIVFALLWALYLATLCPTIYPGDGAELSAAAWCLGVPHPTGYPLFMVLGHLLQKSGIGSAAFATNLMSATFGALAGVGVYRFMRELLRHLVGRRRGRQAPWRYLAAATALAMGTSATWWDQSTQTEVYSLLMAFVSFAWAAGLRVTRTGSRRALWGLAFLSGVAFLHHQLFLVTTPLSALGLVAFWRSHRSDRTRPDKAEMARRAGGRSRLAAVAVAVVLFAAPLTGYVYLPMRAAAHPAVNWGNPHGIAGIVWHLSGRQYTASHILSIRGVGPMSGAQVRDHLAKRGLDILGWIGKQYFLSDDPTHPEGDPAPAVFGMVASLVGLLGLFCLWRRNRLAATGIGLGILLNLVLVSVYTISDIEVYQMPLWLAVGALALTGAVAIAEMLPPRHAAPERQESHRRFRAWAAGSVALGLTGASLYAYYPESGGIAKSRATQAHDYAQITMAALPPGAILFTAGDYDIFPLWYAQVVEGLRPDVAVIGANFVFNRWYAAMLEQSLPEGIEVFIGDEPPSNAGRWLVAVLGGMIAPQIVAGHPVFATMPPPAVREHYDLRPAFRVPSPCPRTWTGPFIVWRVSDPDGFSQTARDLFVETFPQFERQVVRRASNARSRQPEETER